MTNQRILQTNARARVYRASTRLVGLLLSAAWAPTTAGDATEAGPVSDSTGTVTPHLEWNESVVHASGMQWVALRVIADDAAWLDYEALVEAAPGADSVETAMFWLDSQGNYLTDGRHGSTELGGSGFAARSDPLDTWAAAHPPRGSRLVDPLDERDDRHYDFEHRPTGVWPPEAGEYYFVVFTSGEFVSLNVTVMDPDRERIMNASAGATGATFKRLPQFDHVQAAVTGPSTVVSLNATEVVDAGEHVVAVFNAAGWVAGAQASRFSWTGPDGRGETCEKPYALSGVSCYSEFRVAGPPGRYMFSVDRFAGVLVFEEVWLLYAEVKLPAAR